MSIQVAVDQLAETLERYRFAYLLTTGDDGRAHIVAAYVTVAGGSLIVTDAGRRTRVNIEARPSITLLWPPADAADYSLIVDGVATLRGDSVVVVPTRAVLHRPAPPRAVPAGGACESDCVEVGLGVTTVP
jgi:pyridoxamine 5'-phosphate oxidase-like protein